MIETISTLKGCKSYGISRTKLSHPFRVQISCSLVTGGLRYAPTTGYFLATLRVAVKEVNQTV